MPKYSPNAPKKYIFNSKRIKRGLYQTKTGYKLNVDINEALNILKKSSIVCLKALLQ